jgi:protein-L-isoaspartate(D-aspartate) O-methyltransferase
MQYCGAYCTAMFTLEDCRRFYSEEIRLVANIQSVHVIEAFARVAREDYLGPGPWETVSPDLGGMSALSNAPTSYAPLNDARELYHNILVVLDKDAGINNGQPSSLARWIEALDLQPGNRVYHLGSGVGYYTAIIAEIVGPAGFVHGTEIHSDLAARARQNLSRYPNVTVSAGDGAVLDPGPCDAIFVNAGLTHPLSLWLDRLTEGGRLVLPLTMTMNSKAAGVGIMTKIVRKEDRYSAQIVSPVAIYSCQSSRDPKLEPLLRGAMAKGDLLKMKSVRRDSHEQSDSCVVHGTEVCLSKEEIS